MVLRQPQGAASLKPFLFVALALLFFSSVVLSHRGSLLHWFWTAACGCCAAYWLLKAKAIVPSLLIWIKRREPILEEQPLGCGICGNENCQRHRRGAVNSGLQPWNDVLVPLPVEEAISEFFELVLRDFVYEWYKQINEHEELVDEFRSNLQFIVASFAKRAKKIDVPKLVLEKLVQAGMAHLHVLLKAKEKNPDLVGDAFVAAVRREYGRDLHEALRGKRASIRYLRRVAAVIVPCILPPASLKSKSLVAFLEELTACQLLSRLRDVLSSPDVVNKIIIELIAPAKPVKPLEKPAKVVPVLSSFARSSKLNSALRHSLPALLSSPDGLFHFMQFMKGEGTVSILQFCLTVEDLNKRCAKPEVTTTEAQSILREAKTLYDTYFSPTAWDKIRMDESIVNDLKIAVEALDANDTVQGLKTLQQSTPLLKAYEHVYEMLLEIYCPLFHQSDEYYEMVCGSRQPRAKPASKGRAKNKNVFKRLSNKIKDHFQEHHRGKEGKMPDPDMPDSSETSKQLLSPFLPPVAASDDDSSATEDLGTDDANTSGGGFTPEYDMSKWDVRIRSSEVESTGVVTQRLVCKLVVKTPTPVLPTTTTEGGTESTWTVKRDWKQFRNLDIRLKNFHDDLNVRLPPRGFLLRMSDETAEKKRSELEKYLKSLVSHPLLSGSQLLYSFLTPDTEKKTAFTLDKAGTRLKSVKLKLQKEKGQHLEAFLQTFLTSVDTPRPPHSDAAIAEMRKDFDRSATEARAFDVEERDTGVDGQRYWEDVRVDEAETFHLSGVGDVLQYLIRAVYQAPRWLHHAICCFRVLGQNSLEAYLDSYLCHKMKIIFREDYLTDLIHLLRDLLFFDDDPPRTTEQQKERAEQALSDLLGFPPGIFASLIGRQKYEQRTMLVFEALQIQDLNEQLFFVLLDIILAELFPELEGQNQQRMR